MCERDEEEYRERMREVTRYFRNAVAVQTNPKCEYKDGEFCLIPEQEVMTGEVGDIVLEHLFGKCKIDQQMQKQTINVIIAFKTLASIYENGDRIDEKIEDLNSIFFVPAKLDGEGKLSRADVGKEPWFPREYLYPMIDSELSVGDMTTYDEYVEKMTSARYEIETWEQYVQYAIFMYETVTHSSFDDAFVQSCGEKIALDNKYYIFEDKMVDATKHILSLYNELQNQEENKLYAKLTNGKAEPKKQLISNDDVNKMMQHAGQMNGQYPLSPSQREAINHFNEMEEGNILAVGGPPGTGKTTLLQSIVADMYVNAALGKKDAPLIVATSMNNQPVTNIIESFRSIENQGIKNLEHKWITGADKFAIYFPSSSKMKNAMEIGYQCSSVGQKEFFQKIEAESNRRSSKEKYCQEFKDYFGQEEVDLERCVEKVYQHLNDIDRERKQILNMTRQLFEAMGNQEGGAYLKALQEQIQEKEQLKEMFLQKQELISKDAEACKKRYLEWQQSYQTLPLWVRLFPFLPWSKNREAAYVSTFSILDECQILQDSVTYHDVQKQYQAKLSEYDMEYRLTCEQINQFEEAIRSAQELRESITKQMEEINQKLADIYSFDVKKEQKFIWNQFTPTDLNELIDKIRYKEFWMAAHYYEGEWLLRDTTITVKQIPTNFEKVLDEYYHRMAMIAPCMVMTTFMLPKQFQVYGGQYLYNYIDILIVDEAGQISPEMIAGNFSLAKKALVVGDEHQISPVWGVARGIDKTMAMIYGVIAEERQFEQLEHNGLNCSQSNIMKVAALSCAYNKYEHGMFLNEHRRCYDEIISYCNKLVYKGRLQPKRGSAYEAGKKKLLPPMGHYQVSVEYSHKIGGSRENREEAEAVVTWLTHNYTLLIAEYQQDIDAGKMESKDVIGIITPFKGQALLIKKELMNSPLAKQMSNISVGTVHTFQGAERRIILFSTVYGSGENCYFIDKDESMMNVAVSRAKDAFIVFGDRGCFSERETSATYLLGHTCEELKNTFRQTS